MSITVVRPEGLCNGVPVEDFFSKVVCNIQLLQSCNKPDSLIGRDPSGLKNIKVGMKLHSVNGDEQTQHH